MIQPRIPTSFPRLSTLALTLGVVTLASACDPDAYAELDGALETVDTRDSAFEPDAQRVAALSTIEAEFLPAYEGGPSDYDLALAEGDLDAPGMELLNPSSSAVGSKPFHIQKYGHFSGSGTLSTGFPTSSWIATVVGIQTTNGDINENGAGDPIYAFPWQSNGIWNVSFDVRSHGQHEGWSIWVMYINRDMATSSNF